MKEAKENNCKFKSNCECKKLLGERWEPVFRGGNLDMKYKDINQYIKQLIQKNKENYCPADIKSHSSPFHKPNKNTGKDYNKVLNDDKIDKYTREILCD